MRKVVLNLDLHDDKGKQKVMKAVSGLSGIDSISMDMTDKKLTVTGDVDPIKLVKKLKKQCYAEILTVGPPKKEKKERDEIAELIRACNAFNHPVAPYYRVVCADECPKCIIC